MRVLPAAAALVAGLAAQEPARLTFEIRVFDGVTEVTTETRVAIHRAGERAPAGTRPPLSDGRLEADVPAGLYDVQAVHERDGRVLNIRWANRLVVMPYPDERGRHLEVINFSSGFGALQIRAAHDHAVDAAIFESGRRDKPVAPPAAGAGYALFVVRAGSYDLQVRTGGRIAWHTGLEVPLDRTRFWVIP